LFVFNYEYITQTTTRFCHHCPGQILCRGLRAAAYIPTRPECEHPQYGTGTGRARTTRSVELTPDLPTAQRLLADWDQAFDDLGRAFSLQQGKLSIAAMPSFAMSLLPPALVAFRAAYPSINVAVDDIVMEDVIEAVRQGRVDLGITFEPEQLDGVDFIPLFTDRFIAILPPDHCLADKQRIRWKQLEGDVFIAMNRGSWLRRRTDAALTEANVVPRHLSEANQLATIGRMVSVGLGVSVVPDLCRNYMESLGIACRPISQPVLKRQVGIFTHKRHALSMAGWEFISILRRGQRGSDYAATVRG